MSDLRPFAMCGIQMTATDFIDNDAGAAFDRIQAALPLNAASIFPGKCLRREEGHQGGSHLQQPVQYVDEQGRDVLDRMLAAAEPRNIRVIMGIGEECWGYQDVYRGYTTIGMVDHLGRIHRQSCVNRPAWRDFQIGCMEDTIRLHPQLRSFMFMHERQGPLSSIFAGSGYGDGHKGFCFCEDCCRKGRDRGLDPCRAREGYRALSILQQRAEADEDRPTDGWFVSIWRLLMRYPEIMAWDQLWWDSLHDYRAAIVGVIKALRPEADVGFHFQHATLMLHFPWRAGDDPERVVEYADWVKPSVYPGASGVRASRHLRRMHHFLLRDMPLSVARDFLCWIGGHDPADLPDITSDDMGEAAFGADWVERECRRLRTACSPRPLYAGLGIGIPAGENAENVDLIRDCAEACYRAGAQGILLSRHFGEMRPELLQAAGSVIRRQMHAGSASGTQSAGAFSP
jgi:hypothetical protein